MTKAKPRIISASRRTDIPAYYADWFCNRLKQGFCAVPNPFNPSQVSRISLRPEDVLAIVFWTRNPRPMFDRLEELDSRGYRYYFQYTLMNNPRAIDPSAPTMDTALASFLELVGKIGADRVIWRYDPIMFTETTDAAYHLTTFRMLAGALEGATRRCVVSIVDNYRKTRVRLRALSRMKGFGLIEYKPENHEPMLRDMRRIAEEKGMELFSCAEEIDLSHLGIQPGKCVDDDTIRKILGVPVDGRKDRSQRKACGCVESRDIGVYDTCLTGCRYCYATSSFENALANYQAHDAKKPCLLPDVDAPVRY